jgi:hypothetical protein
MARIKISLHNSAGELDGKTVTVDDDDSWAITRAVIAWLDDGTMLDDGDTIRITELDDRP